MERPRLWVTEIVQRKPPRGLVSISYTSYLAKEAHPGDESP